MTQPTLPIEFVAYLATSLDGFIAREDGGVDWLDGYQGGDEDYGFVEFMDSVDWLVMGRNTFEQVLTFGEWPYGNMPVTVISSKEVKIPEELKDRVSGFNGTTEELAQTFSQTGVARVYVDGGQTIRGFLEAGQLTELILTIAPILLGKGIPLFQGKAEDQNLKLIKAQGYDSGLVQLKYQIGEDPTGDTEEPT